MGNTAQHVLIKLLQFPIAKDLSWSMRATGSFNLRLRPQGSRRQCWSGGESIRRFLSACLQPGSAMLVQDGLILILHVCKYSNFTLLALRILLTRGKWETRELLRCLELVTYSLAHVKWH